MLQKMITGVAGAALGAYTQDPLDNPLAGLAGLGIGAVAGFNFAYQKSYVPIARKGSLIVADTSKTSHVQFANDQLSKAKRTFDKYMGWQTSIRKTEAKGSNNSQGALKRLERLKLLTDNYRDSIKLLSQNRGLQFSGNVSFFLSDAIQNTHQSNLQIAIDAMKIVNQRFASAPLANSKTTKTTFSTRITSSMGEDIVRSELQKHFKQLGHNDDDALRKATNLAFALHGSDFSLENTTLHTKTTDGPVEIPLTAHAKNQFRFTTIGDTMYASKAFNPFARLQILGENFEHDKLGVLYSQDSKGFMHHRLDPEEILGFYRMSHSREEALNMANAFVRRNIEYLPGEANLGDKSITELLNLTQQDISEHARRVSALSIGFMEALKYKKGEGYSFEDIKTMGDVKGGVPYQSEYAQFASHMTSKYQYDPFEMQSVNTLGRYTRWSMIVGNRITSEGGLFPSAERGYGSQSIRDYVRGDRYNLSRLDVNADTAKWISDNLRMRYSIDDGAGLISRSAASKIEGEQFLNFEIQKGSNGTFLADAGIIRAVNDKSGYERKRAIAALSELTNDFVIGFDKNGAEIKIGNVYTSGKIDDAKVIGDVLHIRIKAKFSGKSQNWIKLFGTSSKAGYTVVEDAAMNRIKAKILGDMLKGNKEMLQGALDRTNMSEKDLLNLLENASKRDFGVDYSVLRKILVTKGKQAADKHSTKLRLIEIEREKALEKVFSQLSYDKIDLIAGSSETGNKFLPEMSYGDYNKAREEILDQITSSNVTELNMQSTIFKKHLDVLKDANSSRLDVVRSATFMLAQTDFKGNADILTTLEHLGGNNQDVLNAILQLRTRNAQFGIGGLIYSDRETAYSLLDEVVQKAITNSDDMIQMRTLVQTDLGGGLHGVGNVGSMSWIERTQLLASGMTEEMLDQLTQVSNDALYETRLVQSMAQKGTIDDATKLSRASEILSLFDIKPESRTSSISSIYGVIGDMALHNLTLPEGYQGEIRSVPISTISTNRTNIYEQEIGDVLSSIEKDRRNLIAMDLEYISADAKKKAALSGRYIKLLEEMERKITKLFKGENNIAKEMSKRVMPGSNFVTARSIGGQYATYIDEINKGGIKAAGAIITPEGYEKIMERAGIASEYELEDIDGTSLKRIIHKKTKQPLIFSVTREPAQGAYSSVFTELHVGRVGLGQDDVGLANILHNMFKVGQFTDYDYDMLKIAPMHFKTDKERLIVKNIMEGQYKNFAEAEKLMEALSRKGNKATTTMHASFDDLSEYLQHQMYSAMKSKQRKILAPHATDLAMNLTVALDRHLRSLQLVDEEFVKRSLLGRTLIHNITESLIKSAHRSTSDLAKTGAVSEIESMKAAYEKLAKGDSGSFGNDIRSAAEKLFSLKGMDKETKAIYDSAMEDIISASIAEARDMDVAGGRLQDFRGVKNVKQLLGAIDRFSAASKINVEEATGDTVGKELSRISNMYQTIRKNIVANKKPIILGGLGLAATAMILGSEKPEMTKETLPYSTGNDTLPPMQSENAHVFKKKEYRQTANIKARHHEKGSAGSKIRRDTFGQNHGGRTNITIRDKRESSY